LAAHPPGSLAQLAGEWLGIELSARQAGQFSALTQLLLEWNARINLTGITQPDEIVVKHYLDSLSLRRVVPQFDGQRLLDVGTGAGFPGLALAIAFPRLRLTLLDATAKKLRFIEHAAAALGLRNVGTVHGRAEELARQPQHRERYQMVTARAVAKMPTLMEYCLPFVQLDGQMIAMRGADAYAESNEAARAIELLGGEIFSIEELALPGLEKPRFLVVVDKIRPSPRRYPRAGGLPRKAPLLAFVKKG